MFRTWIHPRRNTCGEPSPVRGRAPRRAPTYRPSLEVLEDRVVPSTATWDGSGGTNNWTDRFNWVRDGVADVAPVSGDDLVFPESALRKGNVNNLANFAAHSITFSGSGYTISGGSLNMLIFGSGNTGISNTAASGVNRYNGPIQLDTTLEVQMSSGSLELGGALSGTGHMLKTRPGTLTLNGVGANTYTGGTSLTQGLMQLDKGDATGPKTAIPGTLTVFSTNSAVSNSEVRLLRANQIADNATVNVNTDTNFRALLNLNGFSDTIGPLNMTGGEVSTGVGTLTLTGTVFGQAVQRQNGTFTPAQISGKLALGSNRTFTVSELVGSSLGLEVDAAITTAVGGVLVKEGAGPLLLNSTAFIDGGTVVNAGTLEVDDLLTGTVVLTKDGALGGNGQASGSVGTSGGSAQILDDGSAGFTTTGWTSVSTALGYGGDITVAPSTAGTATWTFTGLTPGLYRVFATWPYDPANITFNSSHSTSAPYSIFDNTSLRATATIDQEQAPAGGPRLSDGAKVSIFQQLAGTINITSTTLKVQLSNQVPAETDGKVVIADAVRIERLAGAISPGAPLGGTATLFVGDATLGVGSTYRVDFVNKGTGINSKDRLSVLGSLHSSGAMLVLSSSFFDPPNPGTAFTIITLPSGASPLSNPFENVGSADSSTIVLADGTGQRHTFTINYHGGDGNDVDLIYQNTATQVRDLKLSPEIIKEGHRVTLHGALTDPNAGDVLSLRIDWGDGTGVQTFTDLGTKPFHFSHVYGKASPAGLPYQVRVEWFDQKGDGNFRKLFVTLNDLGPQLFLSAADVIGSGEVIQHSDYFAGSRGELRSATAASEVGSGAQPVQPRQKLILEHRDPKPGKGSAADVDNNLSTDTFEDIVRPAL